jgi:hypothetical protein
MKAETVLLRLLSVFLFANLLIQCRGAITGQWDFKAGNLAATIGQDMSYLDPDTQSRTAFGTTTSFGIPDIAQNVDRR